MTKIAITAPDGSTWYIEPIPMEGGCVGLVIEFDLSGEPITLTPGMSRPDSRKLSKGLLRVGGDATERSFTGGSGR